MRVKEKKRKAKKQTEKWIELLPLILILAVLPMVVHLKIVSIGLENYPWFPDESSRGDFFAYWRTRIFQLSALWMLVVLIDRRIIRGKKWKVEKSWRSFLLIPGRKMVIFILCSIIKKNLFTLLQTEKTALPT